MPVGVFCGPGGTRAFLLVHAATLPDGTDHCSADDIAGIARRLSISPAARWTRSCTRCRRWSTRHRCPGRSISSITIATPCTKGGLAGALGARFQTGLGPVYAFRPRRRLIGLVSLCTSELVPIRSFGFYASLGVMATLTLLFLCVPSALQLWPPRVAPSPPANPLEDARTHRPLLNRIGPAAGLGDRAQRCVGLRAVRHHAGRFRHRRWWVKTSVSIANLFSPEAEVVKDYAWLESRLGAWCRPRSSWSSTIRPTS